jgi:hypothetical protein
MALNVQEELSSETMFCIYGVDYPNMMMSLAQTTPLMSKGMKHQRTQHTACAHDPSCQFHPSPLFGHPPIPFPSPSPPPPPSRVVTSDVFRENHVRRTSSGRVGRPCVRTNVRVGRPLADGPWRTAQADGPSRRPKQTAAWPTAQADGQSCGRVHSHPTEKQPGTS